MSIKHIVLPGTKTQFIGALSDESIQPNAIDVAIDKVLKFVDNSAFLLSEDTKQHRECVEQETDRNGFWQLQSGETYQIVMVGQISVGKDEAGFIIPRSTLNRNGVFITSGLYDSGYTGVMAAAMHVTSGTFHLQRGTRVGQYVCFDADSVKSYNGSYGKNSTYDAVNYSKD